MLDNGRGAREGDPGENQEKSELEVRSASTSKFDDDEDDDDTHDGQADQSRQNATTRRESRD